MFIIRIPGICRFYRREYIDNCDKVKMSDDLLSITGWYFRNQKIDDIIEFCHYMFGDIDLTGLCGMYLRTMSAGDYFKVVSRLKSSKTYLRN